MGKDVPKKSTKETNTIKREVKVVDYRNHFAFGGKKKAPKRPRNDRKSSSTKNTASTNILDFREVAHEVRHLGAEAFVKKSKREYEDEQYELLTGRKRKHHAVPLPIVRGIRKKAAARAARQQTDARESGIVQAAPKTQANPKREKQRYKDRRVHGPAPSIGFMKGGMLRLRDKKR